MLNNKRHNRMKLNFIWFMIGFMTAIALIALLLFHDGAFEASRWGG